MKKKIWMLAAVISLIGFDAITCDCAPRQSVRDAYKSSDAVFTAYVQSIATEPDPRLPSRNRLVVKAIVMQSWKGVSHQNVFIRTASDSAGCGFSFNVGKNYLVYAYRDNGLLATSYCHRTAPILEANGDIDELDKIIEQ